MIKKLISYFFPVTRMIKSEYSGRLELTLVNGRKVLDTAHANYSYGSLQRVLKFSLDQIDLSGVKSVLLLGLGGGSVIKMLREVFSYEGKIIAVDIDPVMIKLAAEEFGILADDGTQIECADAFDFVNRTEEKFDLVIIDLFIDNKIPDQFLSLEFWKGIKRMVRINGFIIFNTIGENTPNMELIKDELKTSGFKLVEYNRIEINKLLIASYDREL